MLIVSVFPITGNIKVLSVLSGSMESTIHTGSVIVIKPINDYKVGDIVTFGKNTKTDIPITHRILESRIQDGQMIYKTKGDANNSPDGREITKDEIIGKSLFSVPYFGYLVDFVKKPIGLMIAIFVPAIIIIYDQIQRIIKEAKQISLRKKEKEIKNNEKKDNTTK